MLYFMPSIDSVSYVAEIVHVFWKEEDSFAVDSMIAMARYLIWYFFITGYTFHEMRNSRILFLDWRFRASDTSQKPWYVLHNIGKLLDNWSENPSMGFVETLLMGMQFFSYTCMKQNLRSLVCSSKRT
jgi:hypothetical protein